MDGRIKGSNIAEFSFWMKNFPEILSLVFRTDKTYQLIQ